jgi:ribosomal protein S18 acetylase RimI-like enzyme
VPLDGRDQDSQVTETIALRPAGEHDFEFRWALHRTTMREYVERTWGWDEAFQAQRFRDAFANDRDHLSIVVAGATPVGCLRVVRDAARWFLAAIVIAPSHQRQGIGAGLVASVCFDAGRLGLPVDLQVLKVNPAIRLYRRLGFVVTGETPTHFAMRRKPEAPTPSVAAS